MEQGALNAGVPQPGIANRVAYRPRSAHQELKETHLKMQDSFEDSFEFSAWERTYAVDP